MVTFVNFPSFYLAFGTTRFDTQFLFQGDPSGGYGLILFGWYLGIHWPAL